MSINDKWEFFRDLQGNWRWRCVAPNGTIVCASLEGYFLYLDCLGDAGRNGYAG